MHNQKAKKGYESTPNDLNSEHCCPEWKYALEF